MKRTMWTILVASNECPDYSGEYIGATFHRFANALKQARRLAEIGWTVTIAQS